MAPSRANFINALILIALGIWGYVSNMGNEGGASPTALIAPAVGLILLLLTPMWRKGNKVVAHIGVLLTLLIVIALFMPLSKAMGSGNTTVLLRVGTMILSSLIALMVFISSFVKARKERTAQK